MSIYFGNDTVNDLYIGLTPVSKGYVGTHLFYNSDNTIIDLTYEKYILNTQFNTLYNTEEAPIKSAILKGNTLDSLVDFKDSFSVNNKVIDFDFLFKNKINFTYTLVINITEATSRLGDSDYIEVRGVRKNNTVANIKRLTQKFAVGTYSIDFTFNEVFSKFRLAVSFNCVANAKLKGELHSVKMPVLTTTVPKTEIDTHQLEEGSVATEYEPYKSTTVTCNEDVELRGIGTVKDELNLLTGELTQRVDEVVLDGSQQNISVNTSNDNTALIIFNSIKTGLPSNTVCVCDKLPFKNSSVDSEHMRLNSDGQVCLWLNKTKFEVLNAAGVNEYLLQNPITVQYPLVSGGVKTVDLSVVDQDGNDTKLSTFDDITHVTLSSEGLIPEAELEVATKNEEVLNTMSLEMDDISTTQNALQETSNTQSENVDATMLATTEIYEGLL